MSEPVRVLMLFTNMNRGGAESMVMSYYRNIDRTKLQFDFMVHRLARGAYDDEIETLGGRIFRMMPFYPFTFKKYARQISVFFDAHPEYKIVHGHCSELGYFVYKEAAKRGVPVIIAHAHNSHALYDLKWFFRTWFKYKMRRYLTDEFTCGHDAAVWLFGKHIAKNAILQRNAIDTNIFRFDDDERSKIRKSLNIPDDAFVIGHVGRFNKQKNHTFIIDIFHAVFTKRRNSYLILVGNGELEDDIKRKVEIMGASDYVKFVGTRDDVPNLLSAMDVFLFPSFMEGLSLSMVEAQCSGLPCVASDKIPKEVVMTDLVSFLSLNNQANIWADIVLYAGNSMHDRISYYKKISAAGYDIKKNAEWLQNFYFSALK